MNMKIPLLTLTATLTAGCLEKEEVEETEETEETESGIDGDWSLSDSDEGCYEDSYTDPDDGTYYSFSYCFSFSKFDMSIVEGVVVSSDVTVGYTDTYYESSSGETETESYSFDISVTDISGSGTSYTLEFDDEEVELDCTLSGSTLDCELNIEDEIVVGVTLTK
jgi:hypothetical protein